MKRLFLAGAVICLVVVSIFWLGRADQSSSADEAPWFADATDQAGLDFVHDAGPAGSYFMPQIMGSGAALFDFNNDGRLDILLLHNAGPKSSSVNQLYQQLPDGSFKNVSKGSGLDVAGFNMGVAIADVNNDGWPDVLITQYGGVKLFLNQSDGTFVDVTKEAGLESTLWGASACFFDYDRDGWLDLVVVNYIDYDPSRPCLTPAGVMSYCTPKGFNGSVTKLFRNLGKMPGAKGVSRVRFEDVTITSGLGRLTGPGLGVVCADFNGDGWPDICVANDGQPNRMWINKHDGTFSEDGTICGVAYDAMAQAQAGMGVAVGDVDGDGLLDIFVTHLAWETHTLWQQGPKGLFQDRTSSWGLTATRWRTTGFGTVMGDFNQDGVLDLALVAGSINKNSLKPNPGLGPFWSDYGERNQLFANTGTGKFRDISRGNPALCGAANVARGLAVGDVDGDGALDLLVTTIAGPARLYRNVVPNRGHWLLLRAIDPALKRDAYGALITVRAGAQRWLRLLNPCSSYLCSNDPRVHFGLGQVQQVDDIQVLWPDGATEVFAGGTVDRQLVLRKGEGRSEGRGARGE